MHASGIRKILVATDGSRSANRALDMSIGLAKELDAELFVLTVLPVSGHTDPISSKEEARAKHIVDEAMVRAKAQGVFKVRDEAIRATDSVVSDIVKTSNRNQADLIVVGARALGRLEKLWPGRVSTGVTDRAKCSVLVAK